MIAFGALIFSSFLYVFFVFFFLSELHHYGIICGMVLHMYVGFEIRTIIDGVQDVTQSVLFCFILYIFSGILYIAVGVKIVF